MSGIRILVTGCSGYLGQLILPALLADTGVERVVGIDWRPLTTVHTKLRLVLHDLSSPLGNILQDEGIQVVLHLAFILTPPLKQTKNAGESNYDGSRRVLEACADAPIEKLVWLSSSAAYGAHLDNPKLLSESNPLRPVNGFPYSRDKARTDEMASTFAAKHSDVAVTILRSCPVVGPIGGSAVQGWFSKPFLPRIIGTDPLMQFLHEDDLVQVLLGCILRRVPGIFNVAGDTPIRYSEVARLLQKPLVPLPSWLLYSLTEAMWRLGLNNLVAAPAAGIDFIRYPWVVSNKKIKIALGLDRLNTCEEALTASPWGMDGRGRRLS